jgi:hypothetical protein
MTMAKKQKKAEVTQAAEAAEVPEVMPAERAVAKRAGKQIPTKEMTPEARVDVIRGHLDSMESVQTVFAAGAVTIGLELLSLKSQTPRGEFETIFEERIARPRFTMRTARKYMQAADRVRTKLLRSGSEVIAGSWDIAPSSMTIAKRNSLHEAIGEMLTGKSLSDLLMGDRAVGGGGKGGSEPATGKAAEEAAIVESYEALCRQIVREIITGKRWQKLDPDALGHLRTALRSASEQIEAFI